MYSLGVHVGPINDLKDVLGNLGITAHDYSFHDPHCYRVGNCAFEQHLEGKQMFYMCTLGNSFTTLRSGEFVSSIEFSLFCLYVPSDR